jgi:hypothetical protein
LPPVLISNTQTIPFPYKAITAVGSDKMDRSAFSIFFGGKVHLTESYTHPQSCLQTEQNHRGVLASYPEQYSTKNLAPIVDRSKNTVGICTKQPDRNMVVRMT